MNINTRLEKHIYLYSYNSAKIFTHNVWEYVAGSGDDSHSQSKEKETSSQSKL